jgi:hypothetical protein
VATSEELTRFAHKPGKDLNQITAAETAALLKEVAVKCNLSWAEAKMFWSVFCQCSARHLAEDHKSVDLGYCVIHPMPLRKNWKGMLACAFATLGPWLKGAPVAERERVLVQSGWQAEIRRASSLAVRGGVAYIGLEVVPKAPWWRVMLKVQKRRISALGPAKYCQYLARLIQWMEAKIVQGYVAYLQQIAIPCGSLRSGRYRSNVQYLIERVPKGKVVARNVEIRQVSPVLHYKPTDLQPDETGEPLVGQDEDLPEVPTLQQDAEDVRDGDEPTWGGAKD